jgi:hypothetical protein
VLPDAKCSPLSGETEKSPLLDLSIRGILSFGTIVLIDKSDKTLRRNAPYRGDEKR